MEIQKINAETLKMMKDYSIKNLLERENQQKIKMKKKCEKIASNLHHLISTQAIPGVFKVPFREKKKILGKEVDIFLKQTFKSRFRNSLISKRLSLTKKN